MGTPASAAHKFRASAALGRTWLFRPGHLATAALENAPHIAPSQSAMVVRRHPETGERYLDLL
jgi:hypothetical protein